MRLSRWQGMIGLMLVGFGLTMRRSHESEEIVEREMEVWT